jgi:periplasmic divalent cation tolerance protein
MSAIFVYVTVPSAADAKKIAEAVIQDRLAACANILPGMHSIYHWEGKIEQAEECVVLFKTRATLFQALEACVKEMHKYTNPCVVALPVTQGSAPYLEWLMAETKP